MIRIPTQHERSAALIRHVQQAYHDRPAIERLALALELLSDAVKDGADRNQLAELSECVQLLRDLEPHRAE